MGKGQLYAPFGDVFESLSVLFVWDDVDGVPACVCDWVGSGPHEELELIDLWNI